ncbi:MAG: cell envelope integrity protein TolA [Tahibacter sp.]
METPQEKWRAFGYSLLVHLCVVAVVTVSVWWTRSTIVVAIPGPVIEATLIGPAAAPKPKNSKPKPAPPKPPEPTPPKPVEAPPPEPPKEDTKDQDRIAALAIEKAEQDKKEQDERHKREQILLEEQKKADATEKKKQLEEEKKKQLLDKQAKEQAEKDKKLDQKRLAELMEAEQATTGQEGKDEGLEAQYFAAIKNSVVENWLRPESAQPGLSCMLRIIQIPGGDVINVVVSTPCNADPLTQDSLIQAVKRGALPYKGYEPVFRREFKFEFKYDG